MDMSALALDAWTPKEDLSCSSLPSPNQHNPRITGAAQLINRGPTARRLAARAASLPESPFIGLQ